MSDPVIYSTWQPIALAPTDGRLIDLWCIPNPIYAKWRHRWNEITGPMRVPDMVWTKPWGLVRGGWKSYPGFYRLSKFLTPIYWIEPPPPPPMETGI